MHKVTLVIAVSLFVLGYLTGCASQTYQGPPIPDKQPTIFWP